MTALRGQDVPAPAGLPAAGEVFTGSGALVLAERFCVFVIGSHCRSELTAVLHATILICPFQCFSVVKKPGDNAPAGLMASRVAGGAPAASLSGARTPVARSPPRT